MEGKMLTVPNLRVVEPNNIYRKVPTRRPNAEMRTREYLTPAEVEKLIAAAKLGRHGQRDATLILVVFRHGLRAVEIAELEWSQVEWGRNPALHVRRAKSGKPAVHPIRGDELRMLRELQRNNPAHRALYGVKPDAIQGRVALNGRGQPLRLEG